MNNREIGDFFEEKSCELLKKEGYNILERNYQNRYGEIDIIAEKNHEIIFVEVKYRKSKKFGYGYEAINKKKLTKIFNLAQIYIQLKKYTEHRVRFDCMSYLGEELEWIKNIAWGDEIGF
ncbi:YraN family protein [Fusobacterium gastrosuis]|uniref:YraN family protein n=1 Tax=Fusobacterium gastrosuis TaxID=1755100 RepID=UPI002975952A|nr:YraN family protein [Fusobacteriaceae bacterium]MDD7410192.1 YraN family protein [Fusobacteriaceae bacterium]MDY5712576.1 YraN family protein [Fusobacterium gastrosuis]MDY5795562.1 YraN family protein [Fusobacterium gastrosuis]